ncbi:uncharacterized protein METZ01_LOCUS311220 [marine metagenome]|uniref:Uncharacterized protein n=1 Tax=marine metagenome TaxID=408172 RepID=A0A382NBE4_9ZZZZ|tara:strand:+ start:234 stop:737 length:504 start_codon:yes stop_codon:yes gene_type:complete
MSYFHDFIEKIKDTKKYAREKNVPVWEIPLVNSVGMILLTSIYLSFYTWMFLSDAEDAFHSYFWWDTLIAVANWLPLIYLSLICLVMLDKVLRIFILMQAVLTKAVYDGIQKLDHKIWRKTGKDSYIASKIWWVQRKWMGIPAKKRRLIFFSVVTLYLTWYALRLIF